MPRLKNKDMNGDVVAVGDIVIVVSPHNGVTPGTAIELLIPDMQDGSRSAHGMRFYRPNGLINTPTGTDRINFNLDYVRKETRQDIQERLQREVSSLEADYNLRLNKLNLVKERLAGIQRYASEEEEMRAKIAEAVSNGGDMNDKMLKVLQTYMNKNL